MDGQVRKHMTKQKNWETFHITRQGEYRDPVRCRTLSQIHICIEIKVEMDERDIGYYKLLYGAYYLSYKLIWCFWSDSLKALDLLKAGSWDNM